MARKKPTTTGLTAQSVALADHAAMALGAAEKLRIKTRAVESFPLNEAERAIVAELPVDAVETSRGFEPSIFVD